MSRKAGGGKAGGGERGIIIGYNDNYSLPIEETSKIMDKPCLGVLDFPFNL